MNYWRDKSSRLIFRKTSCDRLFLIIDWPGKMRTRHRLTTHIKLCICFPNLAKYVYRYLCLSKLFQEVYSSVEHLPCCTRGVLRKWRPTLTTMEGPVLLVGGGNANLWWPSPFLYHLTTNASTVYWKTNHWFTLIALASFHHNLSSCHWDSLP